MTIKEFLLLYTSSWTVWFMISIGIYLVGQAFSKIIKALHLWEDNRVNNYNYKVVGKDGESKMQR